MLTDLLIHTVTVTRKTWTQGSGGARVASSTVIGPFASRVQAMRSERRSAYGLDASITAWTAYFDRDPGVNAADNITWGGRIMGVIGPARDMGGAGQAFVVDASEVK
jgi:hypothetical protein